MYLQKNETILLREEEVKKVKEQRRSSEAAAVVRERRRPMLRANVSMFRLVIRVEHGRRKQRLAQSLNYTRRVQVVGYFLLVLSPHRP